MRARKMWIILVVFGMMMLLNGNVVHAKTYYIKPETSKNATLVGTVKKHRQTAANGTSYVGYHLVLDKKNKVKEKGYNGKTYKVKKLTIVATYMPKGFKISKYVGKKIRVKGEICDSLSGWYCCEHAIFIKKVKKAKKQK